jgi:DNA-binding NarL/FixJ family response regulator
VKNHLHQIFRKLDVYNRVQAVSKVERRPGHG